MPFRHSVITFVAGTSAALAVASADSLAQPIEVEAPATSDAGGFAEEDVFADRAWLTPTAFSQPRHTVAIATHLLPVPLVVTSIAITGRAHLTAGAAFNPTDPSENGYSLGGKATVLKLDQFAVALHGTVYRVEDHGAATGGVTASFCLESPCRNVISLSGAGLYTEHTSLLLGGASVIARVSTRTRLVFEANMVRETEPPDHGDFSADMLFFGLRITSPRWALDLGAMSLFRRDRDPGPILPMCSLAYRFAHSSS